MSKLKDGLITFGAIYLALTLAGTVRDFAPGWEPVRMLTLILFAGLLALYAFGTSPGRRTGMTVYLLCGLLCPIAITALAIGGLSFPLSRDVFAAIEALTGAFGVGVEIAGDPNMPFWVSVLLWWLGIPMTVLVVIAIRGLIRGARPAPR